MADVIINADVYLHQEAGANRGGPFWITPLIGYVIYLTGEVSAKLVWSKTTDGGATWSAANEITPSFVVTYDCWADWQTAGDAGTKIHIACVENATQTVMYAYLDTNDDSEGTDTIEAVQGTGLIRTGALRDWHHISITKTRGGNIAVAFRYTDTTFTAFYGFYTSPDGGAWTSKTSPWEADADYILLFPANLADADDLWAVFWDRSAEEISLMTYDDSGNSWSEQLISVSMVSYGVYLQMDGAIRLSDGHLLLAAWSEFDTATADLMTWDINGAGSITAKANVITNTSEYALVSVFVNQANDDIYVAYAGGTDFTTLVKVFYQLSQDGGATWDGQTAMQADAEDSERWISCGAVKVAWGGKFQPIWFGNGRTIFTNADNGITILVPAPPVGLENKSANMATKLMATGVI